MKRKIKINIGAALLLFSLLTKFDGVGQELSYISPNAYNLDLLSSNTSNPALSRERTPSGGTFNNSGSKFYIIGRAGDRILQFSLSSNYDISTGTFEEVFLISSQDNNPEDFAFNNDGSKMYVVGSSNDNIYEYSLSTNYDISTATYNSSDLDISTQDTTPGGMLFNDDGLKLFLIGRSSDAVYEYDLTIAYDVSTATVNAVNTLDISGRETNSTGMAFDDDGDRLFLIGTSGDDVNQFNLSTAYDLSTAVYQTRELVRDEDNNPQDVFFNSTGSRMYIIGNENDYVVEYTLSTPYNISAKSLNDTTHALTIEAGIEGITFNNDGSKMYTVGSSRDYIIEYNLSTDYDISSASYSNSFYVSTEDTAPHSIRFNNDGSKLFITGETNDSVFEYNLASNFDLSTISYSGNSYSVASDDTSPEGISFNNDGTKMFIAGNQNNSIYEYTLSPAYDLTGTITLVNTFSVASQEGTPGGVVFNYDGTKMYIIGTSGDEINYYSLSSAFDTTTATFESLFKVNTQDTTPRGLAISNDGSRFFIAGSANDRIYDYSINNLGDYEEDSNTNNGSINSTPSIAIKITGDTFVNLGSGNLTVGLGNQVEIGNVPSGLTPVLTLSSGNTIATLTFTGTATDNQTINNVSNLTFTFNNSAFTTTAAASVNNAVGYSSNIGIIFFDNEYYLVYVGPNSYNIDNLEYNSSFSVAAQETTPNDIEFNLDGSKMYILGSTSDNVNEYDLSTNFDISTATLSSTFSVNPQETNPNGLAFNSSGTRMYIIGTTGDDINQYNLSTPFDVSTATYNQNFSVSSQETLPRDLVFNTDGTRLFIIGTDTDTIYQYNLGTGYDISTASYSGTSFSVNSQEATPRALAFSYDGTSLFVLGSSGDDINEYTLTGAFDISSPTFLRQFSFNNEDGSTFGLAFNTNGSKLYLTGNDNDSAYEFDIISDFTEESSTNNGSLVSGQGLEIYIIGDTFDDTDADNLLSIGGASEVSISNIPTGLTPTLTLSDSDTKATLTFSGSATNNSDTEDVTSLDFTFTDGAFSNISAASINNAVSYTSNIGVEFNFCPRDIRYIHGDWIGGSGTGGRPNVSDDAKGVYVNDDVTLDATSDCFCLEVTTGNALSLATTRNIEISGMLKLNGEIRLIGTSQLIQTHSGNSNVEGTGNLYVDQTSKTSDIYGIGYWSSPVSNNGATNYTVQGILRDGTTPTSASSTPGSITYVTGTDGDPGPPIEIASTWIYGYLNGSDGTAWTSKRETGTFNPGEGFSLKGPQGSQTYTFLGTPNDGDYSFTISGSNYSLLGNPYPSALDANDLFSSNAALATLYFWEHKSDDSDHQTSGYQGGYGARTAGGGTAASSVVGNTNLGVHTYTVPARYIPIAQGFFAEATPAGGTITISNSQRNYQALGGSSIFFKNSNSQKTDEETIDIDDEEIIVIDPEDDVDPVIETPMLRIGFEYQNINGTHIHRQIGATFNAGNSFNYDNGYEAIVYDLDDSDMYFKFSNDSNKYVIAGVQEIEEDMEIPVAIKIGKFEDVKVMLDTAEFITNKDYFLLDKLTNTSKNLRDTVTLTLSKETIYTDRFFIQIKNSSSLSTEDEIISKNKIHTFYNKNYKQIIIRRNNIGIKKASLYNILGKKVETWNTDKFNSKEIRLSPNSLSPNIYVIKLETDFGEITKKLIIN